MDPAKTLAWIGCSVALAFGYSALEQPEGWASTSGGTTGGAGGPEVTVETMADLKAQAASVGKKIILVKKGEYSGSLSIASDKSILGVEPGIILNGPIRITTVSNVIVRNLAVRLPPCDGVEACRSGLDAVYIGKGAHHVWLDHMDIADGQDGNCDITHGADFITITWTKFWYTYEKAHAFSNLIAGSDDEPDSEGKLNITFAFCQWGEGVQERQPRGRYGKVHVLNNLYTSRSAGYACGPGHKMQMRIENNVFKCTGWAIRPAGDSTAWLSLGNIGSAKGMDTDSGSVFVPPYSISGKLDASEVEARVLASVGNSQTLGVTALRTPGLLPDEPRPKLFASGAGWLLRNPTNSVLSFRIASPEGIILFPEARLEAGGSAPLPGSSSALCIRFWGAGAPGGLVVPATRRSE